MTTFFPFLSVPRVDRKILQTDVPVPIPLPLTSMTTAPLPAFIGRSSVAILLDPSSGSSRVSPVLVQKLDLPCSFGKSGVQLATANLHVPTDDGGYNSRLSFLVSYGLASDIILGNDWLTTCEPVLADDQSHFLRPPPSTVDHLPPPHSWHPTTRSSCFFDLILTRTLTTHPASIRLAKNLHDDVEAREALASLVKGCYSNVLSRSETVANHCISISDQEPCDAILHHLFTGLCATQPNAPACRAIAHGYTTHMQVAHKLGSILSSSFAHDNIPLNVFRRCCASIGLDPSNYGRELVAKLNSKLKAREPLNCCQGLSDTINSVEALSHRSLTELASLHGLCLPSTPDQNNARDIIVNHFLLGECTKANGIFCDPFSSIPPSRPSGCASVKDLQTLVLEGVLQTATKKTMRRVLRLIGLPHSPTDPISVHRKLLRERIVRLHADRRPSREHARNVIRRAASETDASNEALAEVARNWPQRVSHTQKAAIVRNFRSATSTQALKSFTCASCAERVHRDKRCERLVSDVDIDVLCNSTATNSSVPAVPYTEGPLAGALVDPAGVHQNQDGTLSLSLCPPCRSALSRKKLPRFALANLNFIGNVPPELKDLTLVEELLVARCRAKMCVVKLQDHRDDIELPTVQRGVKGHIIVFPQHPERISNIMPPPIDDVVTPICILFCGSAPPTSKWLKENARPLVVRREVVLRALQWLCAHNHLYKNVTIDADRISTLPEEDILRYNIEHVPISTAARTLVSRYDHSGDEHLSHNATPELPSDSPVQFESVTITDVDANAPSYQLKAAALRHAKRGGSFIQVPHDAEPLNEFFNPTMFPMLYPSLFPYGTGGFEDRRRAVPIGLENHVKHMLTLTDRRFQEHYSFMFVAFNVIQRRKLLLHTSLRVRRKNFDSWARRFTEVSMEAVRTLSDRAAAGTQPTATTDEERKVLELMKEVKLISANIPGSAASRLTMRNEIRANILSLGVPSFYITVNPADVYNPIVKYLSGHDIDIDNLMSHEVPTYWEQAKAVARNPCVGADFFNMYLNAFFSAVLGYDPKQRSTDPGVVGVVKAYYGCVEAQGRGSLHCHMVVWVHGGLTSDEIREKATADSGWRDRLIDFLDETICNVIPADPDPDLSVQSCQHHACSVRGVGMDLDPSSENTLKARVKDLRNVIQECQCHSHTSTCYKYCKPGEPKECRFELDEENVVATTHFSEAGFIVLCRLDGMVNNYCPTIAEACRCNSDIKFMASGDAAKSVLFYITDYISKTQQKSHVSFGALEAALKKLGEYDPMDMDLETRGKRTLQKCVYSVISHQELSGQQVAAYLKGYGDHYSSQTYRNLYWTAFERSVNTDAPSPECYERGRNPIDQVGAQAMSDPWTDEPDPASTGGPVGRGGDESMTENILGMPAKEDEEPDVSTELHDKQDDDMDQLPELHDEQEDDTDASNELCEEQGDDITITTTGDGNVVQCSSQVHDYRFRALELSHLSVWDFISCVDKVARSSPGSGHAHETSGDGPVEGETEDDAENSGDDEDLEDIGNCAPTRGSKRGRKSQTFVLHPDHTQSERKAHRLRSDPTKYYIPVPIGPALPRRDREHLYARYCRLMLILFKPWRVVGDLRDDDQAWPSAFEVFLETCDQNTKRILDNMQVMHECKDAKDIEDQRRRSNHRQSGHSKWSKYYETEQLAGDVIEGDLLDHIDSVINYASDRQAKSNADVLECLSELHQSGILLPPADTHQPGSDSLPPTNEFELPQGVDLEDMWKTVYLNRKHMWKRKLCEPSSPLPGMEPQPNAPQISRLATAPEPSVVSIVPPEQPVSVSASEILSKWTLNTEQARAFSLIAIHSQRKPENLEHLRMYLGGPGGTGKSRVIAALTDYFAANGESRRLRLASFTGIASKNINGTTLHTALALNQHQKKGKSGNGKTKTDLIAMWMGVDYLFIDEISMIGCNLLLQIHEALVDAKGCTEPFGGINIIFAGDFAQLPPVGQTKLFSRVKSSKEPIIFGQLLWRSVTMVVMLTEQMRQAGPDNQPFVELLSRLRDGRCSGEDYDLLNTRMLNTVLDGGDRELWRDAPIVVYSNAIKDAINLQATLAFARRTGQQVNWYHAVDTYKGRPISDDAIIELLDTLPSNKTGGRVGALPLVLGMPVVVTENFDVAGGVVNGSTGTLRHVRYRLGDDGKRYLTSCIVELPDFTGDGLPHLPPNHVPIIPNEAEMRAFRHPNSGRSCTLRRHQVPLDAAFAITAHKAQGRSMNKVIVDLSSCVGTEAAYVMVSRCTHLNGLLVLRPFPISKITVRRSQDAREEFHRLERLRHHTAEGDWDTLAGGNKEDNASAIAALFTSDADLDVRVAGRLLNRLWDNRGGVKCVSLLLFHCGS